MRLTRRAALAGALSLPVVARAESTPALVVFAAASLRESLDGAAAIWSARTSYAVRTSYGASSALARQIEQGAPADVFIAADIDWMDWLAQRRLIAPGSRRALFSNRLALIAPAGTKLTLHIGRGMPLAAALGAGGRLAVAGTDVPAGRYAKAALSSLGVWNAVKDHLAPAENVRAALSFVARGETPLGIVYDTDARIEPEVRIVGLFPDASHPPIIYPGAVVARSRHPGARDFLDRLTERDEAQAFRRFGFRVIGR